MKIYLVANLDTDWGTDIDCAFKRKYQFLTSTTMKSSIDYCLTHIWDGRWRIFKTQNMHMSYLDSVVILERWNA